MSTTTTRWQRVRATWSAGVLLATTIVLPVILAPNAGAALSPVLNADPGLASADALPTVQINGVVWQQAIVGDTVYAGGNFSSARPAGSSPGQNQVTRNNLLAYNITNGTLVSSFAPSLNGQVRAVAASPDGTRVYVGGEFTTVSGTTRQRIAAFDTATGALVAAFDARVDYTVQAIVATNSTVYVGGRFSNSRGTPRTRLAAFRASDGALLAWNPTADANVNAMVMSPVGNKLIIGGAFQNVNGSPAFGLAAIDATSGALLAWNAANTVRDAGPNSAILSLTADATSIYGTGYKFGGTLGNLEGAFRADAATGNIQWIEDCHGDTYDIEAQGGYIYTVSHAHHCGNIGGFPESNPRSTNMRHAIAFTTAATGTIAHNSASGPYTDWFGSPSPSMYNWFPDLDIGTFTGQAQAAWDVTANADYVVMGGEFPTVNGAAQQGLVRFARRPLSPTNQGPRLSGSNFEPGLVGLGAGVVRVGWQANWDRDDLNLTYNVIRDNDTANPIYTTSGPGTFWNRPPMGYVDSTVAPGSTHSYRIQAVDPDGNSVLGNNISFTAPSGALSQYAQRVRADGPDPYWRLSETSGTDAYDFSGFNDGTAGSGVTRNVAGAIVGDPDKASSFSGNSNGTGTVISRQLIPGPNTFTLEAWVKTTTTTGGKIIGFGNNPIANSGSFDRHLYMANNGAIYFGANPGTLRTLNSNPGFNNGQWHHIVGTLGSAGMSLYVDGVRVGNRTDTTSGQAFSGYWKVGGDNMGTWPNRPTNNYFTGSIDEVAIYPTALSAATVAQHYQLGTGAGGANQSPVAAFSSSVNGLSVSVNGSGSSDPDGSIASYSWNWGDGTPASSGVSPSHAYAVEGTYTITLTIEDDDGAPDAVSHPVSVAASSVVAADSFTRTVANGWGSANTGGAWSLTGGNDKFSVTGSTGRIVMATPGAGPTAILNGVSARDIDGAVDVAIDKVATGSGMYANISTRRIGTSSYQFTTKFLAGGTVTVSIARIVSGTSTSLGTATVAGLTVAAGDSVRTRFQVVGTGTTTLAVKAWKVGSAEPGAFQLSRTDSTAALQVPGAFALQAYLSSSSTNAPVAATVDNLAINQG